MDDALLQSAVSKAARRLIWLLILLYFVAVLDRVNVGIAAVPLRHDLGLTAAEYGFGAGIFFLGYVTCEVPSNLALARFGARVWLSRIAVTWGIAAMLVTLAKGAESFAAFRFLLGVTEAGFFPGVLYYLTLWFPAERRARINALFFLGIPLSNALAAALSAPVLALDGTLGLAGWQWLFLMEGAPAVIFGVVAFFRLPDRPAAVTWLTPGEKGALAAALESPPQGRKESAGLATALRYPMIWVLGAAYFGINVSLTTTSMWVPQVIHSLGEFSVIESGLITAAILLPAALVMFLWSRHSDLRGERIGHLLIAALACAAGWALSAVAFNPVAIILVLALAAAGTYALLSVFWTFPAALLSGRAAAGGMALVSTLGNFGAFFGPWAIGVIRGASGGFAGGLMMTAGFVVLTGVIAWAISGRIFRRRAPSEAM